MKEKVLEVKEVARECPNYEHDKDKLYLRGKREGKDDDLIIVYLLNKQDFLDKIDKINAKYGKRWRAKPRDESYYYISERGNVERDIDYNCLEDDFRYNFGNYFKTETEAEIARIKIKKLLLEG